MELNQKPKPLELDRPPPLRSWFVSEVQCAESNSKRQRLLTVYLLSQHQQEGER
jgi:hypothetical protein